MSEIKDLANQCLVPRFKDGNERPCDESDFAGFVDENLQRLVKIKLDFINQDNEDLKRCIDKELLTTLFLILGENSAKFPWNTDEICILCAEIRVILFGEVFTSESEILMQRVGNIPPLLKPVLLALRPKLLKETWKEYPAAVESFAWVLGHLKRSYIADNVQHILPTALLLVDDFVNENRVLGIKCLDRVINDMTISELKYHGYGELIYKALQGLLRERNAAVADVVIPCIFTLLSKLEYRLVTKWSLFDDTLEILLEIIEIENQIAIRSVYSSYFTLIIKTAGSRINRWSKRVLSIFDDYLEVGGSSRDYKTASQVLTAMTHFLELTKSVSKYYRQPALLILFRSLYHFSEDPPADELHEMTKNCLRILLEDCTDEESKKIITEANDLTFHPVFQKIVKIVEENVPIKPV